MGKYVHHNRETAKIVFCTSLKSISISDFVDTRDKVNVDFLWQSVKNMASAIRKLPKRNSHTSKIVCLLPVCLTNNKHLADHISEPYAKFYGRLVKNCASNCSRPDEIDTETEICASLKSEFYFRFRGPPSTSQCWLVISHFRFLWWSVGKHVHHNCETEKNWHFAHL